MTTHSPSIAVGDRVLFTNPSTGQQLIGTVVSHDPEHRLDREWRVDFDSWMFRDVDTRIAHVATEDLARIDYAYKGGRNRPANNRRGNDGF